MRLILSSMTFFALFSSLGFADPTPVCANLKDSLINKVCVGDLIRSGRQGEGSEYFAKGEVIQIEPALAEDQSPMSILTINARAGALKLTSRGIVFIKPGTCTVPDQSGTTACIGDQFKSETDGRNYVVTGIAVSDGAMMYGGGVIVQDKGDARFETTTSVYEITLSRKVENTGIMSRSGSCNSEIPFLASVGYAHLPSCAIRDARTLLGDSCSRYCGKKVDLKRADFTRLNDTPNCEISYNLFPPHKKVCSITLEARCPCSP